MRQLSSCHWTLVSSNRCLVLICDTDDPSQMAIFSTPFMFLTATITTPISPDNKNSLNQANRSSIKISNMIDFSFMMQDKWII